MVSLMELPHVPLLTRLQGLSIHVSVHHGIITECIINCANDHVAEPEQIRTTLVNQKIQDIRDWRSHISADSESANACAEWLREVLPVIELHK